MARRGGLPRSRLHLQKPDVRGVRGHQVAALVLDLCVDFEQCAFRIAKEQRPVPPALVGRRLDYSRALATQVAIPFIDFVRFDSESKLNRDRYEWRRFSIVRAPART